MCKKSFLLIFLVLVLALTAPTSADELLASYEPNEMTDLSFRTDSGKDPTLTIMRVLGGVGGAPPATDGDYILKWEWTDESGGSMPYKVEIWHEWDTRRLDLAPYNLITCDVWFAEPGAQPATIGIWDDVFGWAGALSVPIGIGRWHTVEMDIGGMYQSDIDHILALLFEGLAGKAGVLYTDNMWLRFREQVQALGPIPFDKAVSMDLNVDLSWTTGIYANSHDVYFGTDFNDVNDATRSSAEFKVNKSLEDTIYDPGTLEPGKTYYWRIDEIDEAGSNIWKGDIWSFKTAPSEYVEVPLVSYEDSETHYELYTGLVISGDADSSLVLEDKLLGGSTWEDVVVPEATDGSNVLGLKWTDEQDLEVEHGCTFENSSPPFRYDLYGFDEMVFDIYYAPGSPLPNSMGIFDWNFKPAHNDSSNLPTTTGQWYTIVIDVSHLNHRGLDIIYDFEFAGHGDDPDNPDNWAAVVFMDNVRLRYAASRYATHPSPMDGATDVYRDADMSWRAGNHAASHDVYFGTDYDDVNDASTSNPEFKGNQPLDANSYDPLGDLELNTTYYWRIDEANNAHPDGLWKGEVWSFTVADFIIIDDFEDYNDDSDLIYRTWRDGYGEPSQSIPGNDTGSIVGWDDKPIAELETVHSGFQSMPLFFDNSISPFYAEAVRTWETPQDWTAEGVAALTIWFQGMRECVGGISYNAATNTYTMTGSGEDIWDVTDPREVGYHDEFHFAYKQLSGAGSIIAKLESLTNTDAWAKAGVMIRETLDANSPHAMIVITPANGVAFQYRIDQADVSTNVQQADVSAPHWVRLKRTQNTFTADHSTDGQNWVSVEGDLPSTVDIPMSVNTYIGLALTAHNPLATAEAVFSDVSTTGTMSPTGPFTQSQDVGIESNVADRLYVILEDDAGNFELVEHSEPNGTQVSSWQEWNIDMREFTNAGVNTAAITKMTLGVGNKAAPSATGNGLMYIDDVRLHLPKCLPSELQPVGDLNDDCVVDESDLEILASEWLSTATEEVKLVADLDDNGDVDFGDYARLASSWLEELIWPVL